ncbi:unnamed protein product [Amoebophrya sp. A120]|nr:unnamed protein product [Amoebophrya sp. A120]|eukprot:GSA120T00025248001.1
MVFRGANLRWDDGWKSRCIVHNSISARTTASRPATSTSSCERRIRGPPAGETTSSPVSRIPCQPNCSARTVTNLNEWGATLSRPGREVILEHRREIEEINQRIDEYYATQRRQRNRKKLEQDRARLRRGINCVV